MKQEEITQIYSLYLLMASYQYDNEAFAMRLDLDTLEKILGEIAGEEVVMGKDYETATIVYGSELAMLRLLNHYRGISEFGVSQIKDSSQEGKGEYLLQLDEKLPVSPFFAVQTDGIYGEHAFKVSETLIVNNMGEELTDEEYELLYKFTYLQVLKCFLHTKTAINANAFYEEIGLTRQFTTMVLKGKRKITERMIEAIIPVMHKYGLFQMPEEKPTPALA